MREIDITQQDVRCCDEIMCENDTINIEYELWFDVDKYFGTTTSMDESAWINFYTYWSPEKGVGAEYTINSDNSSEMREWELTDAEKAFFYGKMQACCQQKEHSTMLELWEKVKGK